MTILFGVLLKEDHLHANLIKGLQQALLVVVYLSQTVIVEPDHALLMVDRGQDEVMMAPEGLVLGQS